MALFFLRLVARGAALAALHTFTASRRQTCHGVLTSYGSILFTTCHKRHCSCGSCGSCGSSIFSFTASRWLN